MKGKLFKRVTALLSTAAMLLTYADFSAIDFSVHAENGDEPPQLADFDLNGNGIIDDGEKDWGYALDSADELLWFADMVHNDNEHYGSANAFLAEDITVNENLLTDLITVNDDGTVEVNEGKNVRAWTPIGTYTSDYVNSPYSGTFDGNNKTISGLYFNYNDNDNGADNVGLFGYVGTGGKIQDVTIADSYMYGKTKVGGICGNNEGTISNCYNTGTVNGKYDVGGVCGYIENGTIEKCYNTGTVNGKYDVGGVCGYAYNDANVKECSNAGKVESEEDVGGVCGGNFQSEISNCYNTGDVTGTGNCVGGVCGHSTGTISNCYNTGAVEGTSSVGGVCGDNFQSEISNCYNTGDVTGTGNCVGGVCGGNTGTITNCYYLNTVAEDLYATAMTAQQFASGEVCWLLNVGQSDNPVFYQNIGKDISPVLDSTHHAVKHSETSYYNEHSYENGFCTVCGYEPATDSDGDGTYEISNAGQLYWFADKVNNDNEHYGNANAVLTDDITVNSGVFDEDGELNEAEKDNFRVWTPIGYYDESNDIYYNGTFDGNNKTISGLYFNESNATYVGLFGVVGTVGKIQDVTIADSYFCGRACVGGVCGANDGTISNCYNTGDVSGVDCVGGVCGWNFGTISNCYNTGDVSGSINVGGVCGNNNGTIEKCYNTGDVTATSEYAYVGGVCGYNGNTISNCYNTGDITATGDEAYVGGVCGGNNGTISNCYNTDDVTATGEYAYVGGVCGESYGTITNCYYLADTDDGNGGKTAQQFASGEVCWLLNGGENQAETPAFFQTLGKDESPVFDSTHHAVKHSETSYYNEHTDFDENGFCTVCGNGYQPATTVKDVNDIDGDDETSDDVYEISNAGQLYWFAGLVNGTLGGVERIRSANAVLTADITVNSGVLNENGELNEGDFRVWTPIGNISSKYSGAFDGEGHTVSGLYFNDSGATYVGLFGFVSNGESKNKIMNLTVSDSYFCGKEKVGGVCGYSYHVPIQNCSNTGTVRGASYVGGVCGYISERVIENCYNTGKVTATGEDSFVGGICGYNCDKNTIQNCYNTGAVSGDTIVGGICGRASYYGQPTIMIKNCYNKGAVSGNTYVGSICGAGDRVTIEKCYYLKTEGVRGRGTGNDLEGSTEAKSAEQFASGEVCWLLNGGETQAAPPAFYQTLDEDAFPVLGSTHNTVYKKTACDGVSDYYNNEDKDQEHSFDENGFCTVCDGYEPATDSDGDGYYEISNAGQLYWFADKVNNDNDNYGEANAVLTNDITVNSGVLVNGELNSDTSNFRPWTNHGSQWYQGTFDGAGYTISGLYFNESDATYVGLFGLNFGTIENVNVTDSYFCGSGCVCGICGYNKGTIENCSNTGKVVGCYYAGGICGDNATNGTITNCYNTGDVTATDAEASVGGVCGNNNGTITNCYNTGDVIATDEGASAGGVCGKTNAAITNCYYLADTDDGNGGKTASQFASGEVCWILNNGDEQAETPVFYQTIGTDERPVFDSTHNTVYRTSPCVSYLNTTENKDHVLDSKKKDATCTEDGHSEYWYCKDCGKYFSDADCSEKIESIETWMSENAIPATSHSYIDGICENCGAFEDGIGARLAGCSISLDGSIGVNFYMQLAEEVLEDETAYILFTLPNGETSEIRVSDAERTELNGVEYYVFKCNVAATEMTDTIKAQIKTSSGNGTEYSYSVKEYADYLLAHTADNAKYAEAEDLVRAMLNYGAYAQTFKKYNTDNLPCELADLENYEVSEHGYSPSTGTKVEFAGANLSMLSNTTLRLFFEADDINGVTIMYDAEALEIGENNGLYFVEIANITPDELSNDFTVSISDGGLVTYSPMTYCYQVSQTSNDAALVNLVKAIAMYNDAAEAYFKEAKV